MIKPTNTRMIWDAVQGARRAKTGMYVVIHEDFEHYATTQCAKRIELARF